MKKQKICVIQYKKQGENDTMIPKEIEPVMDLVVFEISEKTPYKQLQKWSSQNWPSDSTKMVTRDIVNNVVELTSGKEIDFCLVLKNIKVNRYDSGVYSGRAAIAVNAARTVGGIAVALGCSMDDPRIVVISGMCLIKMAKDESSLEDFRNIMTEAIGNYGKNMLPEPDLYMEILQSLFTEKIQNTKIKVGKLLQNGNIEEVHKMINSRGNFEISRMPQSPKTTTSSILTPPNPSI